MALRLYSRWWAVMVAPEHHPQLWKIPHHPLHGALDKDPLPVEDVDVGVGDLGVYQQGHVHRLHGLQGRVDGLDAGDAVVGVGGGPGRVQFGGPHHAAGRRVADLFRPQSVGQVEGHQWLETHVVGQGFEDSFPIGQRLGGRGDRRFEVGHHDGAGELPRAVRQYGCHGGAVTQVQVPVVGSGQSQFGGCGHGFDRKNLWIILSEKEIVII
jgi:hypothetical protein